MGVSVWYCFHSSLFASPDSWTVDVEPSSSRMLASPTYSPSLWYGGGPVSLHIHLPVQMWYEARICSKGCSTDKMKHDDQHRAALSSSHYVVSSGSFHSSSNLSSQIPTRCCLGVVCVDQNVRPCLPRCFEFRMLGVLLCPVLAWFLLYCNAIPLLRLHSHARRSALRAPNKCRVESIYWLLPRRDFPELRIADQRSLR